MKICVLGLRGLPRVLGGVETHCEQLFPLLKKRRPRDSFTIIARTGYVPEHVSEYRGLRIVSLPHAHERHLETITNTIYGVLYARFVLHAELLHLHGIGPALVAPIAKALGMKVVVTYHSKNYDHSKWNRFARLSLRLGERCAVSFGDRVIAVSQSLAADLRRRFPRAAPRIHFIPNGASHLGQVKPETRPSDEILSRYGLASGKYIISVGRLVPEKGFHDLLEAFRMSELDCKLVIVGDALHKDSYSSRLLKQTCEKVLFPGFLGQDVLQVLLQNASLFVLPSYNEGLPLAALEAAAAGAPLLLSDIEPNRDLGLDPDHYFAVGNVADLQRKLAWDHQLYRVDRESFLQRYDWETASEETDKLYSSLQSQQMQPSCT